MNNIAKVLILPNIFSFLTSKMTRKNEILIQVIFRRFGTFSLYHRTSYRWHVTGHQGTKYYFEALFHPYHTPLSVPLR